MSISAFFSESYCQGRERFLSACHEQGAVLSSEVHPNQRGPAGEELAIDFAWLGPEDASRVLLLVVGTHGYEAYAGAATVLQWLKHQGPSKLPADTAVAIVHGLNPYGWAWDSRFNEDFVDLNRNWMDFQNLPEPNPQYPIIHEMLALDEPSETALKGRLQAVFQHLATTDNKAQVLQAITGGQYSHADGLNYGGTSESWSLKLLREFVRSRLSTAQDIRVIDQHTGLGPHGEAFLVCLHAAGSDAEQRAHASWGKDRLTHESFYDSGEAAADYQGLVITGLEQQLSSQNQTMTGIVVEWGTYANEVVLGALLLERWLRFACGESDSEVAQLVRKKMREAFYPESAQWRESVLLNGAALLKETLESWHD